MELSARASYLNGVREALGVPVLVLVAGYLGFGALAGASGVSLWFAVISSVTIWALPGQLVLLDMWQAGAPLIAVILAVSLANARFLPMTMTLMPMLRDDSHPTWRYYLAAHLVAMVAWVACMRRCPGMPARERLHFFMGFGTVCVVSCEVMVAIGYLIADAIPQQLQIGLVFLSPLYFFVIMAGEVRSRLMALALGCGAVAGPLCQLYSPQWGVLMAGVGGGSVAFLILKATSSKHA